MMNNEDTPRSMPYQQNRKPMGSKYPDAARYGGNPNYNYNFNATGGYASQQQQHPRRRVDRFKRESLNSNDRLVRQNDLIIKLLKEIRDRLPPPPPSESPASTEPVSVAAIHQPVQMEETEKLSEPVSESSVTPATPINEAAGVVSESSIVTPAMAISEPVPEEQPEPLPQQ